MYFAFEAWRVIFLAVFEAHKQSTDGTPNDPPDLNWSILIN